MAITQYGINFTALHNATLNLTLPSTDEIITQMPETANSLLNGWLGWIILLSLTFIIYISVTDKTPYGDFKYDDLKGLALAFGLSSVIGVTMVEIKMITNLTSVGFCVSVFTILTLAIVFFANKE